FFTFPHIVIPHECAHLTKRTEGFPVKPPQLTLILISGSYYCSDNPGALQTQIESTMVIKTSEFSSLYSWYSWPNTVLCFLCGFLIDRVFGIRMGAIIFSTIIIVGQ
ncbi:unnamed protein product, partial [Ixodes pacificus]